MSNQSKKPDRVKRQARLCMLKSIALLDADVLYALSKMRTPVSAPAIPRDRANGCGDLVLIQDVQQFGAFVAGAYPWH